MLIEPGEKIFITVPDDKVSLEGTVYQYNDDDGTCIVNIDEILNNITGKQAILYYKDKMFTAQVVSHEKNTITFSISGEERRSFFRVDDAFPIKIKKVSKKPLVSRFLTYYAPSKQNTLENEYYEDALLRYLNEINRKLDYLINTLILKEEGLLFEDVKPVNISASGIRIEMEEKAEVGDVIELKMILPSHPPIALLTYGEVVRVIEKKKDGKTIYETALKFTEMSEEIREEIIQYTLKRERELIKSKKLKEA